MLIALSEYAEKHGKSSDNVRRLAENGKLQSAKKIGRNWVVDSDEPYPVKKRKTKDSISVISLFSGCGGMDLGFIGGFNFLGTEYPETGFEIVWANEINPFACKTYRTNFGDNIVEGDISEHLDDMPKYADVIIGGFPCQDISINGKMLGLKGQRSSLYTYIVEAVRRIQPKVFVAENVGGLLLKKNSEAFDVILKDFGSLGYNVNWNLYHAEEYGVPQTRNRVFIVGTKQTLKPYAPPEPTTKGDPITLLLALLSRL